MKDQEHFGLEPFCSTNPAPAVSSILYHVYNLLLSISLVNSLALSLLQLTDSFWKPASGAGSKDTTEAEAEVEEEIPVTEETTVAEDVEDDEDADEESSQEAPTANKDDADEDEESSPEAPTKNVVEEESSREAPIVEDTDDDESSPEAARPSSSKESSAKSHSSSSPASNNNGSRESVPKVPLSRVLGSARSPAKPEKHMQSVIAARKRKLRSDGPADAPEPLPVSHQRKSASPPHKDDSYHSGMSMPSSDSQASLDLETNIG